MRVINSKIIKHSFLASKKKVKLPSTSNHENVIFLSMIIPHEGYQHIHDMAKKVNIGGDVQVKLYGKTTNFKKTKNSELILKYLNGIRTIGEIIESVKKEFAEDENPPSTKELENDINQIFKAFIKYDWMFLRHKSVPLFDNMSTIQKRLTL